MGEIEVPQDLSGLDADALQGILDSIQATATSYPADMTVEQVRQLEDLAGKFTRVRSELDARAAAAAQSTDPEPTPDPEPTAEVDPEPTAAELADRATSARSVFTPPEPAPVADPVPAAEPVAAAVDAVASLARETNADETPPRSRQVVQMTTTHEVSTVPSGTPIDRTALAEEITRKRLGFTTIPAGTHGQKVSMATARVAHDIELGGTVDVVFAATQEARDRVRQSRQSMTQDLNAWVASGGICDLAAPIYDVLSLAEPQSPVEGSLQVVGAPRGAIKWIVPPDWTDARSGVGVTGTGEVGVETGEFEKPCVHVNCPGTAETAVVAVSTCVEWDNLTYRVFPELVATFMDQLAANFASVREVFYLDKLEADVDGAATATQVYGAHRFVHRIISMAAHAMRKRHNMNRDAVIDVWAPDFLVELLKADMANDAALGLSDGIRNITTAQITAELAAFAGVNVTWYYDSATGLDQSVNGAQGDGALNAYPDDAVLYLEPPGTHVRLDAGTLDVGLVRDSTLNRTNDLQLFSEMWINTAKVGLETVKLTLEDICPTGTAPPAGTVLSC